MQQQTGSDTNPTDYPSSEPQENQKDSTLATASSQLLPGAPLKHQKHPKMGAPNTELRWEYA